MSAKGLEGAVMGAVMGGLVVRMESLMGLGRSAVPQFIQSDCG